MQSTAIKDVERGANANVGFDRNSQLHDRSISTLARDPCRSTKSRNAGTSHDLRDRTVVSRSTQNGRCRRNFPRTNDRVSEWETRQAPDYSVSRAVPRSLGPGLVPVLLPLLLSPLYYHQRAFSSSHHGRRTAMRELLLFVGRRPAQAAGFSMISNPFRRAYARNRPEPTALKQSPRIGRLTEFQLVKN